jgi:hypothetical protein
VTKSILDQISHAKAFLQAAGLNGDNAEGHRIQWFFNPTNRKSLRLTRAGNQFILQRCQLECYDFRLPTPLMPKHLLQLERRISCPYFIINLRTIRFFGEVDSIMLSLHGNDLGRYLDTLSG